MKLYLSTSKNASLVTGFFLLLILLMFTFFGRYLPFIDEDLTEVEYVWDSNHVPVIPPFPPSSDHILGTDTLGRDVLSLLVIGAKETLILVILITIIRYGLAIPFAYFAHKKKFGMQNVLHWLNMFLSYIPTIILVILIVTIPPLLTIEIRPVILMFVIAFLEVGRVAEWLKLEFDELASKEYMISGVSIGISPIRLLNKYYMPFVYGKLLVNLITDFGKVMFLLGQLGFIGIFLSQQLVQTDPGRFVFLNDSITWPALFINAFADIRGPIWIPFYAALCITYTIFTFNLIARGVQRYLEKKTSIL